MCTFCLRFTSVSQKWAKRGSCQHPFLPYLHSKHVMPHWSHANFTYSTKPSCHLYSSPTPAHPHACHTMLYSSMPALVHCPLLLADNMEPLYKSNPHKREGKERKERKEKKKKGNKEKTRRSLYFFFLFWSSYFDIKVEKYTSFHPIFCNWWFMYS